MAIRDEFDGDLYALQVGDKLTHGEELAYPEGLRDYDHLEVVRPTQDGRWIAVRNVGGDEAMHDLPTDLVSAEEIALVLRRGSAR